MKKVYSLLIALLLVILPVATVFAAEDKKEETEKEKVKLHIFYGETCSFCQSLHAFTDKLLKDKDYNYMFEVVDYEVWYDETNNTLMSSVAQYLGVDVTGVPFYVIGEKSFSGYSDETSPEKIKEAIEEAYNDEDYEDIVSQIGSGSISVEDKDLDENGKDNDLVGYIILGVTAVIVIAIILGRSRATYYEDEILEDVEETNEEESKEEESFDEETNEEIVEEEPEKTSTSKKSSTTKKTTTSKTKK